MHPIELFSSKAQAKILSLLSHSNNFICIQEILQCTKIGTRSLYLALNRLEQERILRKKSVAKELKYQLDQKSPYYQAILAICKATQKVELEIEAVKYQKRAEEVLPAVISLIKLSKPLVE